MKFMKGCVFMASTVYKSIAWVIFVAALIGGIVAGQKVDGSLLAIIWGSGFFVFLSILAIGIHFKNQELMIECLEDVSSNTRRISTHTFLHSQSTNSSAKIKAPNPPHTKSGFAPEPTIDK
ncbi:MAG: hypothetical protein LBT26_11900 [Clostridiales Family XIII bacterium]|jgi:hypothetical protein|nr:hypothetical protein [Clostridiales Family XIII bacterium]